MIHRGARPPGGRTCAALHNAAAPPPPPVSPSMRRAGSWWTARLLASSLLQAAEAMSSMELSSYTCGDLTMAREFNFVSPGFPVSIGHDSLACSLSIDHGCGGRAADPASDQAVCQLRLDFDEFSIQPPLLGNCIFDMFYVGANGKYPLVCGDNSGHHLYLNVEGRATTDLTFILSQLQERLYSCPDKFGVLGLEPNVLDTSTLDTGMRVDFSNPIVNIGNITCPHTLTLSIPDHV